MDAKDSDRFTLLRFPLIVGVVFIHAANGAGLALSDAARAARPVQSAISLGFAAVSVPLFFLLSGYLFFQLELPPEGTKARLEWSSYVHKLRRRIRTLLVPYLFWNLLLAAVYFGATRVPQLAGLMSGAQAAFVDEGPEAVLQAVLGLGREPVVYQFWFLRNLMIAVLLVPLFEGLFRALGKRASLAVGLFVLGVPWALHRWPIQTPNAVSLFFFYVGAWAGRFRWSAFALDRLSLPAGALWAAAVGAGTLGLAGAGYPYLLQVSILLGVIFVLGATARGPLAPGTEAGVLQRALRRWAPSAFFLFAIHEPLLTAVIRIATRVMSKLGAGSLPALGSLIEVALYFGSVAIVCAIALLLHRICLALFPRATSLVTGGR